MANSPEFDKLLNEHNSHGWVKVPVNKLLYPNLADTHIEYECPCKPGYHFTVHRRAVANFEPTT